MAVIRSTKGRWLIGMVANLRVCTSNQAKLWAVDIGLRLAWDHGFRFMALETDAAVVYQAIQARHSGLGEPNVLISMCKEILCRNWTIQIMKIYREGNCIADGLANWVLDQDIGQYLLQSLPPGKFEVYYLMIWLVWVDQELYLHVICNMA